MKVVLGGSSTSPTNYYYTIRNLSLTACLLFEMQQKIEPVVLVEVSDVSFCTRHL